MQELLSQSPNSEMLFIEEDLLAIMGACQSMLPVSARKLPQQCMFTQVEAAWKEKRFKVSCTPVSACHTLVYWLACTTIKCDG